MIPPGYTTFKKPKPTPSGSGGTLGSAMQKAQKLMKTREQMKHCKWTFQTGAPEDTKLFRCPGCGEESCHYIGGGPKDIECLNRQCEFFKLPPGSKKEQKSDSNDDFDFGNWGS